MQKMIRPEGKMIRLPLASLQNTASVRDCGLSRGLARKS